MNGRGVGREGAGGAAAPPDFGVSEGAALLPASPGFLTLAAPLSNKRSFD